MSEDIKPVHIYRPHHLRPLSRQVREENNERFRKQLAELAERDGEESEAGKKRNRPMPKPQEQPPATENKTQEGSAVGRNLDMST
jgi:hypothetical protein